MLRSAKYGLYGAVVAGLVALPAVWNSVDKTVDLVVDGRAQVVHTTAADVGDVVRQEGYRVTSHDLLAPVASSRIENGTRIVLRRGRLLHLDVDGVRTDVWTTAPTVAAALAQLGYSTNDFVSVSRDRRLPLGVTDIAIRTPRLITVVHDGRREQVTTTDQTVGQVLADLGIALGGQDRLSVPLASPVTPGEVVTVQRVSRRLMTKIKWVPYPTLRRRDSSLLAGTTQVVRRGRDGRVRETYALVYVDGKLAGRTLVRAVTLSRPTGQVLAIGTRQAPAVRAATTVAAPAAPAASPGSAMAIAQQMVSARGWGSDQYDCLVSMWDRESGWNVHASNPSTGAYGIPQALPGSKMASAGPDWENSASTQIAWGLGYIAGRYGTPCGAWSFWQANGWY